jgi:4-hydroxybenzoate polyprenyltransferase
LKPGVARTAPRLAQAVVPPKWRVWAALTRLDRPVGWLLLLWPTLWALWLAGNGAPSGLNMVVFLLGVVLTRSAGCAINDYADRIFDGSVARTQGRPLALKWLSPNEALVVAAVLALLALGLVLLTNKLTIMLACVAAALAIAYPFTKRFFPAPQMVLGAAFGMGVPMAYAAETNAVPPEAWLLFIANWFWCVAYDTLYAMADRQDDLKLGLRSSAILFGELDRVAVAMLQAAFVFSLVLIGRKLELQWPFWLALGVAVLLLARQLWLIRARDPIMSLKAFRENNGVGLVLTLGILAGLQPT